MARDRSPLTRSLNTTLTFLMRVAPYSSTPQYPAWKAAVASIEDTQAALDLIEAFKPGLMTALMEAAVDEAEDADPEVLPEIRALIRRYVGPRCIIR